MRDALEPVAARAWVIGSAAIDSTGVIVGVVFHGHTPLTVRSAADTDARIPDMPDRMEPDAARHDLTRQRSHLGWEQHRMTITRHRGLLGPRPEPDRAQIVSALVPTKPRSAGHIRGLPLTPLSDLKQIPIHYALTVVDSHGRCANRSALRSLRWGPGHHLTFTVSDGAVYVVSDLAGLYVTTRQGHLRFPAAVRHRCRMEVGEQVLLTVLLNRRVLIAYTAAALDAMIGIRWPLAQGEQG